MPIIRRELPLLLLLIVCLISGLLVFQDYGLSWDEPLYYDYGKSSQYAYSISARLEGTFDLEKSFGKSPSDHVTRGPAYLLIAGLFEGLFEKSGLDLASAWHLTNFLDFLAGLVFFYFLARFWLDPWPAAFSTALLATQPVIWNHAFMNPKDVPFAVFFLISMSLGFRMIENWDDRPRISGTILPGIFLGITMSIRFLAPFLVLLLLLFFALRCISMERPDDASRGLSLRLIPRWKAAWAFIPYGVVAIVTMIVLWPFLWPDPLGRFVFTLRAMSETSANLKILFMGNEYPAYSLPRRFFPVLLSTTLTEPTWILFGTGVITALLKSREQATRFGRTITVLLWFAIPILLLVAVNPPNSDGYRHYLFILPPVFLFAGFGLNSIFTKINKQWLNIGLGVLLLLPGIHNIIILHPYEYTYYNSFLGGTKEAFRRYETDYWLTCYKDAVDEFNTVSDENARLFVKREPYIAAYYSRPDITILDYRADLKTAQKGDYLLINSRSNEDIQTLRDAPIFLQVGRSGAIFCVIKEFQ